MPSCEALSFRRGRAPHHAHKDRVRNLGYLASGRVRGTVRIGNGRPYRDRRKFITLLGGTAAWPITARAQQPAKLPTIWFLGATTPSADGQRFAAFVQRLRELGIEAPRVHHTAWQRGGRLLLTPS